MGLQGVRQDLATEQQQDLTNQGHHLIVNDKPGFDPRQKAETLLCQQRSV